jgi:hypothetical protein
MATLRSMVIMLMRVAETGCEVIRGWRERMNERKRKKKRDQMFTILRIFHFLRARVVG